jgi:hypothetical protein
MNSSQMPAAAHAHGVHAAVPVVEAAHHRHALGVGRPDGEAHAVGAVQLRGLGAHAAPGFQQAALVEQVDFLVREQGAEGVGIGDLEALAVGLDGQSPGPGRRQGAAPFEQAAPVGLDEIDAAIRDSSAC